MKVFFVSLGCDKNKVDSEKILHYLMSNFSAEIVQDVENADVAIVNTCSFIKDAKDESTNWIKYLVDLKKKKIIKKIMVCGCFATEAAKNSNNTSMLKNIDVILPQGNYLKNLSDSTDRFFDILSFSSNLKICDGCDKFCTYCIIPYLRGRFMSTAPSKLVLEAKKLGENGVKELNIVGQDTLNYGNDFFDKDGNLIINDDKLIKYSKNKKLIVPLIDDISKIDAIKWIRLLYCYIEEIDDSIISLIKNNKKVLHYIDIPIQHINDKILKLMNRKTTSSFIIDTINKLRREIPDIAIRTTLMVGFPGESDDDFNELCDFVRDIKFDKLGVFTYSREKMSKSYDFENQISEVVKEKRKKKIMDIQKDIVYKNNEKYIGHIYEAIVEGYDTKNGAYVVRPYFDARDIDDKVYVKSKIQLISGSFVDIQIDKSMGFDLIGHIV